MFDFINSLDFGLIQAIVIFFIVILSIKLFSGILRKHRILRVLLVGAALLYICFNIYNYIDVKNKIYATDSYYVYGMIKRIDEQVIELDSVRTNLKSGGQGRISIKKTFNMSIIDSTNNDKVLKVSDLSYGDTIQVICDFDRIENSKEEIKVVAIIVKAHRTEGNQ